MSSTSDNPRPTIARIWRGRTTRERADEYARYLSEAGILPLEEMALGVQMFRDDRATESEFITVSYWESVEAMSRFAGDDPNRIHHLEPDPEFLIELPSGVQVLDFVSSSGRCTTSRESWKSDGIRGGVGKCLAGMRPPNRWCLRPTIHD